MPYSESTKQVIDEILNDPELAPAKPAPSYEEIMKQEHSMRFKHE
jgi:hypothetical protein